ncbi:tetrahydrofolate dehydrogenase/cyclohydrolase catalytic domain-containing protein, partial [Staphylococcus saprophyticus]|uniref:tetrahydrofolate dehydrogenase/cyclohydrolase catalytic domain-containing protein n=1 Tax=Staphylococcus saprophyticus TaxID=29385 RepID=UPI0037039F8E
MSQILHLHQSPSQPHLLNQLKPLNQRDSLSGILLQLPLPHQLTQQKLLQSSNPPKHLHPFHPQNIPNLYIHQQTFLPSTPLPIIQLLNHPEIRLERRDA